VHHVTKIAGCPYASHSAGKGQEGTHLEKIRHSSHDQPMLEPDSRLTTEYLWLRRQQEVYQHRKLT
jgi:hypothetical protein